VAAGQAAVVGDGRKCAGCLICQMVCSFRMYKEFNPAKAQLTILFGEDGNPSEIVFKEDCEACGTCVEYCPRQALVLQ
jgi:Fe-S-cluster-containing dehydrogenase component